MIIHADVVCYSKRMKHSKLNTNWNADPNAPEPHLEVHGDNVRIEFFLNPFIFDHIEENDKGELIFKRCYKYSFNTCNDEGYYRGEYRYDNKELPWGEFYEIKHDWENDFHPEYVILNYDLNKSGLRHFIFFFRDNTLECIAKDFEFNYLNKK
jgi:hypothetical protein